MALNATLFMEENELEVVDTPVEETQEEVNTEEETNDTPTVEDYLKLKKEAETLKAQKEHWRKKAETIKESKPLIKETNEPQSLTREEAILYAKGYTEDEVALAIKLAAINSVTPLKASEDEYFKTVVEKRLSKEKSEKASLGASSGGGRVKSEKPIGEMTREEHEAYYKKVMGL